MTDVITEPCIGVKDKGCVDECPGRPLPYDTDYVASYVTSR